MNRYVTGHDDVERDSSFPGRCPSVTLSPNHKRKHVTGSRMPEGSFETNSGSTLDQNCASEGSVSSLLTPPSGHKVKLVTNGKQNAKTLERLKCPFCEYILRDSIQTEDGVRLCEGCAKHIKGLPGEKCSDSDISVKGEVVPDFAIRREVLTLFIHCDWKGYGCEWEGHLKAWNDHETSCDYRSKPCQLCSTLVQAHLMAKHRLEECLLRETECEFCSVKVKFCETEDHQKTTCPNAPTPCKACKKEVIRQHMAAHLESNCENKICSICDAIVDRAEFREHVLKEGATHFDLIANSFQAVDKRLHALELAPATGRPVLEEPETEEDYDGEDTRRDGPGEDVGKRSLPLHSALGSASQQVILEKYDSIMQVVGNLQEKLALTEKSLSATKEEVKGLKEENAKLAQRMERIESMQNEHSEPRKIHMTQQNSNCVVGPVVLSNSGTINNENSPSSFQKGFTQQSQYNSSVGQEGPEPFVNAQYQQTTASQSANEQRRGRKREDESRVDVCEPGQLSMLPPDKYQPAVTTGEVMSYSSTDKRLTQLEDQVTSLSTQTTELELQHQASLVSTFNGDFIWRIPDVSRRIREAKTGKVTSIYSPPFFSSPMGYKMCVRAYMNGDGMGERTHLSLFFVIMKGEFDALLSWPFQTTISLSLINQDNRGANVTEVFRANPKSKSFQRPSSDMNVASGCPRFASLDYLNNPSYVKQDTLFIRCSVDSSTLGQL